MKQFRTVFIIEKDIRNIKKENPPWEEILPIL